jgi:hypothetical protein
MAKEKYYEITIHLDNIHDLFTIPTGDPFSENVRFVSGIEFIKSKFKPKLLRHGAKTRTTIFLPKESIEPDIVNKTRDALKRYCQFKIQQNRNTVSALQLDSLRALLVGLLFLATGLFLTDFLSRVTFISPFFDTLIANGFTIAFWVILWRPVDFFLFDMAAYWREVNIYKHIMQMEIIVAEEVKNVFV